MSINQNFWDIAPPTISPSKEYSYLRFSCENRIDMAEVFLPDDTSYLLSFGDLRRFLEKCGVDRFENLIDFIYNFKYVVWNRYRQTYYPVSHNELFTKKMLEEQVFI